MNKKKEGREMNRFIKIGMGVVITIFLLGNVTMPKAQAEDFSDWKILPDIEEGSYTLQGSDYVPPYAVNSAYEGSLRIAAGTDQGQRKFILHLEGNHYEMGFQHGYLLAPIIEKTVDESLAEMLKFFFQDFPDETRNLLINIASGIFTQSIGLFKDGIPTRYQNEIWGIVHGVAKRGYINDTDWAKQRLFNKIVALNIGPDLALAVFNWAAFGNSSSGYTVGANYLDGQNLPHMCDGFVVKGQGAAQQDKVIMGRNFMYTDKPWWKYGIIIEYYPHNVRENGQDLHEINHVGVGMAGLIGIVSGMNAKGIGVGANLVSSSDSAKIDTIMDLILNSGKFGMGAGITARKALAENAELDMAIEMVEDAQVGAPWLFTIADGKGSNKGAAAVGKGASGKTTIRYMKDDTPPYLDTNLVHLEKSGYSDNLLVTSNFFMKREMYAEFIVGVSGYLRYNELLSRVEGAIEGGGVCFDSSEGGCGPINIVLLSGETYQIRPEYRYGTKLTNYLRYWDTNPKLYPPEHEKYSTNYPVRELMATSVTLFDLTTTRMKTLYSKYDHDWVHYDLADN